MPVLSFSLATPADDAALRGLLRANPMRGAISLSFEREPGYFYAGAIEGPLHQTIVTRESAGGEVVGMVSRSARPLYINGEPQMVGYISLGRVAPKFEAGLYMARAIAQAFAFMRGLHADGAVPFYFTSIVADNQPARRLFGSGFSRLPHFQEYAGMHTFVVLTRQPKPNVPLPAGLRLTRGCAPRSAAIVECLQRNGARRQLAPYWTADTLFAPDCSPGLASEDFFLALDGERVVGCLACWDQSRFKQTVVRSYAPALARWRRVINLGARLGGWPPLPPLHTALHYCYASHLAVDDDNPQIFAALLRALYNHAARAGYRYLMLGLSAASPLRRVVTGAYRPATYASQLYWVAWEDGLHALSAIDARLPGPEVAVV